MLNLPQTTEFNKRLPKKKFYEQLEVAPEIKRIFVNQIKNIIWKNKIAPSTTNISVGENVTEIEVFEVQLNSQYLDEKVLKLIDQGIPYHIVFVLHYEKQIQLWTAFKESLNKGGTKYRVEAYYHTDWLPDDSFSLKLSGLNMDQIYEDWIRKIAGEQIVSDKSEPLKKSVERTNEIKSIKKKINNLQIKLNNEKQFNKRSKIGDELDLLLKKLEVLLNEKNENGINRFN